MMSSPDVLLSGCLPSETLLQTIGAHQGCRIPSMRSFFVALFVLTYSSPVDHPATTLPQSDHIHRAPTFPTPPPPRCARRGHRVRRPPAGRAVACGRCLLLGEGLGRRQVTAGGAADGIVRWSQGATGVMG